MSMEDDRLDALALVDTSYDQPVFNETVTRDITTQRQDIDRSTNDQWTGFFQKTLGTVLDYGVKRDAARTGVQLQRETLQNQRNPYYNGNQPQGAMGLNNNQIVIFGGLALLILAMKK